VACLQELKATDSEFPVAAIEKAGYGAVWRGQKSRNGVTILARGCEPVITRSALPGDPTDTQSRYMEAAVNGVLIATLYAPNGNPQPGPKFKYKLAWMERLLAHAAGLYTLDAPVVLAGDYNVVPTDADIYPTKSYAKNALIQPQPAPCSGAFSIRAGSTPSARSIQLRRCTRSGITCEIGGSATPVCESIICCSTRKPQSAL
jgi:exodeoxyribonuclease III